MIRPDRENLITIVGGAGYIGSCLTRLLLAERFPVRVFDNFSFGSDGLAGLSHQNLEVIDGDMLNIKELSTALAGSETVILLAAVSGRRFANVEQPFMRETNLLASSVALDAAVEHGAQRFLFASTESVYGPATGLVYETATPDPISLYARLKLRMEEQVLKAKKRAFHPTVLRVATCFGYSPRMRFDLKPNKILLDAVEKKEIVLETGEESICLIHVEDAARAFVSCVKAHVNLVSGETFNLGAYNLQLNQFANSVKGLVPDASIQLQGQIPELKDYQLSNTKIQKILDFSPQWTIQQGLQDLKEQILERQFGDPYDRKYHNLQ